MTYICIDHIPPADMEEVCGFAAVSV